MSIPTRTLPLLAAAALALAPGAPDGIAARLDPAAVDAVFAEWNGTDRPGCVCAVSGRDGVVFERAYGMANLETGAPLRPDSVFYVASVSKQFTAAAVALLAERGKVDWDADARAYVPQLRAVGQPITLRQLAWHTSGVRDYFGLLRLAGGHELDYMDNDRVLRMLARQHSLQFDPGARNEYSNTNYVLLAELVHQVSGEPFVEFTRRELFEPLGMQDSRFEIDHGAVVDGRVASYAVTETGVRRYLKEFDVVGDGGMLSTAADLTAWGRNLMAAKVLMPATIAQMLRRGHQADGVEFDYGLGHRVEVHRGTTVVGHTGSFKGFRTRLAAVPEHGVAIAVLCNADRANASALTDAVLDLLLPEPEASPAPDEAAAESLPAPPAPSLSELQAWAGAYWADADLHTRQIYVKDGALVYGRGGRDTPLEFLGEERFAMPGFGIPITLEFARDAAGHRTFVMQIGSFQRVEYGEYVPLDPTTIAPDEYLGSYYSDEIDARYRIAVGNDGLSLRLPDGQTSVLSPIMQETFVATFASGPYGVRFRRTGDGGIDGMAIDSGWIRGLWFAREPAR